MDWLSQLILIVFWLPIPAGIGMLLGYLYQRPEKIEFQPIVHGVVVGYGAIGITGLALVVAGADHRVAGEHNRELFMPLIDQMISNPWIIGLECLKLGGENGAFFLPLLIFGFTRMRILALAGLFGLWHMPQYGIWCLPVFAYAWATMVFVLPRGITPVWVSHVIIDFMLFAGMYRGT